MTVRAVGEPIVDLVAVHEQVVPIRNPGQLVLDRVGQHGAGRVARVAEEERLGPRRDRRLDRRRVEGEIVLEACRDVHGGPAREHDGRNVRDVRRLMQDDLVARIARRPQGEVDRLRRADGDQQLGLRIVCDAVEPLEVGRERPAQLERAVVRRVVGPPFAQ